MVPDAAGAAGAVAGLSAVVVPEVVVVAGWVLPGWVLGCVVPSGLAASAGLENSEGAAGAGADAAVPGVLAAVDLAPPPRLGNKPPLDGAAAAGVDEGVEEVAPPPRAGNSDLAGVLDVAGVEVEAGVLVVAAPVGGVENSDGVGFCSPPADGAAGAAGAAAGALPNREGLGAAASLLAGVDSAGLPSPEKSPPPPLAPPAAGAEGVDPSEGFCCVFDPKRPPPAPPVPAAAPESAGFGALPNNDGVVEPVDAGAADEAGCEPKRPPPGF